MHVWVPSGWSTIISVSSLKEETICLKDATATFDARAEYTQNIVILLKEKHHLFSLIHSLSFLLLWLKQEKQRTAEHKQFSSFLIQQTMEEDPGFLTLITLLQLYLELFGQLFKNEKGTIKEYWPSYFTRKVADSAKAHSPLEMAIFFPGDPRW